MFPKTNIQTKGRNKQNIDVSLKSINSENVVMKYKGKKIKKEQVDQSRSLEQQPLFFPSLPSELETRILFYERRNDRNGVSYYTHTQTQ